MPGQEQGLIYCYNRGCGQLFKSEDNTEESCLYHPGAPFFHDAYKGWSCCKKKCTDFTEFLNIKGCAKSYHSNVKPPEPEKPPTEKSDPDEVIEYKAPAPRLQTQPLDRPSFETPLVKLEPTIAAAILQNIDSVLASGAEESNEGGIKVGTSCKNGGCKTVYEDEHTLSTSCKFHPGVPVFHEGLKFWSCCVRRTTDFNAFLDQEGCETGSHVWVKKEDSNKQHVNCRYDWHQTGSFVVISIYAKKYHPHKSAVHINPVRLKVQLFFPEDDESFKMDLELRSVVDVAQSSASFLGTKVEIKLRKAEPGHWPKLDFPRAQSEEVAGGNGEKPVPNADESLVQEVDAVDLSDL